MRFWFLFIATATLFAQSEYTPWKSEGFNPSVLTDQSSIFAKIDMQQSYSVSYISGPHGSQSSGVYLNHISYPLSSSVTLFTDIGMYNLFYSQSKNPAFSNQGIQDAEVPEMLFPGAGLEYRPNDNFLLSLHFMNGQDAYKAYGWGREFGLSPLSRRPGRF